MEDIIIFSKRCSSYGIEFFALLPASILTSDVSNLGFRNFSAREFQPAEVEVLGLSLGFTPTPSCSIGDDKAMTRRAFETFMRSIYLTDYFHQHPTEDDATPPRFRIPKPGFHPRGVEDHMPSPGIAEFHEAAFADISKLVESRVPHVPNLSFFCS